MTDLADFLLARIAEEEAEAQMEFNVGDPTTAGWSPARVLAECEAKRRIVAKAHEADAQRERYSDGELARIYGGRGALAEHMLCLLSLPYADHPDYREEWKP